MKENDRKVVSTDHRAYGELHGTLCMTEKDRGKYPVFLFHGDIKWVLFVILKILLLCSMGFGGGDDVKSHDYVIFP